MTAEAKTIPEDIRRAARSALFDAIRDKRVGMTIKMMMAGLSEEAFVDAIATAIQDAVMAERERIVLLISEQASALAEAAIYGLAENARSREAMEAALTKFSHIIRVAALPASPKTEGE